MPLLTDDVKDRHPFQIGVAALAIACLALILGAMAVLRRPVPPVTGPSGTDSLLRVTKSGVLRVGYGGFPPYTIIDPKETDPDHKVKGFSVDVVEELARRASPPLKISWNRFNWDTLKNDMMSDKFDFVVEPVFETIPRAMDFAFSQPYSFFGIAVAVVGPNENRFKVFEDLDRADITIALAAGYSSSEYAQQHLSKPKLKSVIVSETATAQLDEVPNGHADVALNDVPTVAQYVSAHKGRVKALWLDKPPSSVPGAFMLKKGDLALQAFLDAAIEILKADGTLGRIDAKWRAYGFIPVVPTTPGRGLAADMQLDGTRTR